MKVNVRSTKLKGTVLFTVVSVLMVLIVILLGTLALAATASNRAYQNYQKEQTEYTARALLDSVVAAVNADNSNDGIKSQIAGLSNEGAHIDIEIVRSDNPRRDAEGNPVPEIVTVTKMKSQYYYIEKIDPDTSKPYGWQECNVYDLSTTVSKTMADTTYSVKMTDMPINTPGVDDGGGAFVSMGSATVPTQGLITGGTAVGIDSAEITDLVFPASGLLIIESNSFFRKNLVVKPNGTILRFADMRSHVAVMGDLTFDNNVSFEFSPNFDANWADSSQPGANPDPVSYQEVPCIFVGGRFYSETSPELVIKNQKGHGQPINLYCGYLDMRGNGGGPKAKFQMAGDIYAFDEDKTSIISSNDVSKLFEWASKNITYPGNEGRNKYKFGSFYSAGSAQFLVNNGAMEIDGDCRIAKDLECVKNVTIKGDLVVGDTLTVGAGARLDVRGNIYVNNLSNLGEITCHGNVSVINVINAGRTGPNTEIKAVDPTKLTGGKKVTKWVDKDTFVLSPVTTEKPYKYTYSYTEYTQEGFDIKSKEYIGTVEISKVEGKLDPHYYNNNPNDPHNPGYGSIQEAVEALDTNYKKLMELRDTAGQKKEVTAYDVSTLYKKPVYPEGFTKEEILNEIIREPELYTAVKYSGYPQSRDLFETTYGEPTTECTAPGEITESCVIKGGSYEDNIYINADNKTLSIIVEGVVNLNNGAQIIINESNGGAVNIFLDKNAEINFYAADGQIITTEFLRECGYTGTDYTNKGATKDYNVTNLNINRPIKKVNDDLFPDVYIYAGENTRMYFQGGAYLTANIRAPLLTFHESSSGSGKQIKHDIQYEDEMGVRTFKAGDYLSMVGQLIAGEITADNQFGLLHVKLDGNNNNNNNNGNKRSGDISTRYYTYY